MKHNWEYKRLGDVCESINGLWTGKKPPFIKVGVIRNTNFTKQCFLNPEDIFYTDVEVKAFAKRKLKKGDIIIEKSGGSEKQPVGRPVLFDLDGDFSFSNFTATLRLNDISLTPTFLHRALSSLYFSGITRKLQSRTTGLYNLNWKAFLNLLIPVPPMETQEQIVAELDQINDLIDKNRELLSQLDALAQTLFYDTFGDPISNPKGWSLKKLSEECIDIVDGDHSAPPKATEGVPFITISNIDKSRNSIDFSDSFFVPQNYYDGLKSNRKARNGDVLYTVTGSYGITVLIRNQPIFCFQRHIGLIRPKNTLNSVFLAHWGRSSAIKSYADKVATGIAQKTVSLTSLRNFPLILPPLALQEDFAAKVEAIEAQKAKVEAEIAELQTLLDARMDYWFN